MICKKKFIESAKSYFDAITAEFIWHDPDFRNYLKENEYDDSWAESAALTATGIFTFFDSVAEARNVIYRDPEWQADLDEDEEDRRYSGFEEYLAANYDVHEFSDGSVVVKDLFGFELR